MIYLTSDLHFYHEKVIHTCNRPFRDAQEMNEKLILNWNRVISPDDDVFILGDVTMKGPEKVQSVLSRLAGKKYLVKGNHDDYVDNEYWKLYQDTFVWVKNYYELRYQNLLFILFHFPIEEWNQFFKGSIHLHGHQHNQMVYNYQQKQKGLRRYDVGVDANQYTPVLLDDIIKFMID